MNDRHASGDRQVILGADGAVHVEAVPADPAGGPGDVLLAPVHLGICGSDVHVLRRSHPFVSPPVVTGHECVARVLATGPDVTSCAVGDLVVVNPLISCGTCDRCRAGAANQCASAKVLGFGLPGLARDRVVVAGRFCHRVPPGVPARTAVLTEPLAVGWHAAGRAPRPGRTLIIGGGPVGLAVLLALRTRGGAGHITLVEPVPAKRALAAAFGADEVVAPGELPSGLQVDTAFDCVAVAGTLATAATATVPGGTLVVVGVPAGDTSLPLARLQRWEIDVRGTGLYTDEDIAAVLEHLPSGPDAPDSRDGGDRLPDVTRLITAAYPVERAADAFAATGDPDQIKVLIDWPDPAAPDA
ncbi:zinc-dependent alcohol dehydrogenase [Streptosporangium sp. NBC_01756]|uniref:zinc-dependent alcohol dehydrogenase n=1 Tax=Streptosporangium sp. NBC_01756 TaxID=2975950 RepID=UPI002DDA4B98|nr:alcohol dehydrogenase catalytic domain-containing protein [Streptosporangium sp. NBC_01756]WSC86880.1 alcohol dehydrogenase catalytic domain-containing protein [Streptosporangium sp. NBC_01756]